MALPLIGVAVAKVGAFAAKIGVALGKAAVTTATKVGAGLSKMAAPLMKMMKPMMNAMGKGLGKGMTQGIAKGLPKITRGLPQMTKGLPKATNGTPNSLSNMFNQRMNGEVARMQKDPSHLLKRMKQVNQARKLQEKGKETARAPVNIPLPGANAAAFMLSQLSGPGSPSHSRVASLRAESSANAPKQEVKMPSVGNRLASKAGTSALSGSAGRTGSKLLTPGGA